MSPRAAGMPVPLAGEALARERPTSHRLGETPEPASRLPEVPARYVVTPQDRFLAPPVRRRIATERLGIVAPDEIAAGHCVDLGRPDELAHLLAGCAGPRPTAGAL